MTSLEDLRTQRALDEALKILYRSRPARAARLLGLVRSPESLEELVAKQPEVAASIEEAAPSVEPMPEDAILLAEKNSSAIGFRSTPILNAPSLSTVGPSKFNPLSQSNPTRMSPELSEIKDIAMNQGDMGRAHKVDKSTGPAATTSISASSELGGSGIAKTSMTQEEYLMYAAGADPSRSPGSTLTPVQMATFGGGGLGLVAANRLRSGNTAKRELESVRNQFLSAFDEGALDSKTLKNLNQELKLRGSGVKLKAAPTLGIAEAQLARAEKDLASRILKSRYKGTLPMIAAGLLGTIAYNKLNKD